MTGDTDYAAIAPHYEHRYRVIDYHGVEETLLAFAESANDVLEVGCGTGHWLRFLRQGYRRRAGIDPSPEMLSRAQSAGTGSLLVRARAEDLPWANQSFDRLFCINALHHFRDKTRFLMEAHRVLRPGGRLLIVGLDPHATPVNWWVYDYFDGTLATDRARYPPAAEMRDAMSRVGFADCSTRSAQRISEDLSVQEGEALGYLQKSFASQLSLLSDTEFRAGLERLREANAAARGQTPRLRADIVLYATVGYKR